MSLRTLWQQMEQAVEVSDTLTNLARWRAEVSSRPSAKAGLSILAACPADQLAFVIAAQDKSSLTQAEGVGPKIATRILTELKDKAGKIEISSSAAGHIATPLATDNKHPATEIVDQDAVSALTNLGYSASDAYRAVLAAKDKANDNEHGNLQVLIRLALKELSA